MGRIGKKLINLQEAKIDFQNRILRVSGPKGKLSMKISKRVDLNINQEAKTIEVIPKFKDKYTQGLYGTIRSCIANMVEGVTKGFEKKLKFSGVGFRASVLQNKLILNLGFSHPVEILAPPNIDFKIEKNIITISGIDKQKVGEIAAKIRKIYPPEPYKGKGIAYINEVIKKKPGKAAAKVETE